MIKDKIVQILLNAGLEMEQISEDDFVEKEIIDSIMMAEIIIGMEDGFEIEIDPEDITPNNFRNIGAIVNLVQKSEERKSV